LRAVRVDDTTWAAALAKAETEGTTVSTVIRDALTAYTNP
jgi:antitoxin component of RelBE/YafQ-DinJ toxin-antitoxin module